jgi:formylglycine-generating enzyme required for sulfatase activity
MDTAGDITHPTVGPPGTITGGTFVTGKHGSAYSTTIGEQVTFPVSVIPADRGCIELWAKLVGFNPNDIIPWGGRPGLVAMNSNDLAAYNGYTIEFNGNDGWGGGGLEGWAGHGNAATNCYSANATYAQVLGDVAAWHHYALSWDKDGVPGTSNTIQLFLDGARVGSPFICGENHNPDTFPPLTQGTFVVVNNPNNPIGGSVVIDDLKIWSYAKTDFVLGGGVCTPGATQCSGNGVQTCDANGAWGTAVACTPGTQKCASGGCVTCGAGTANCDGNATDCETNLNAPATCGTTCANDVACVAPTLTCSAGTCVAPPPPPSCQGLAATCGPSSTEDCCTSPLVTGGTFYRSYDGVTTPSPDYTSQAYPATVSDFRLDKYEVTVGRFRKFKAAWDGGWRPTAGAGKHTHLNGGSGLSNSGAAGYEPGWDTAWASAPTDANLSCNASYQNWTSSAGANENRPMNCANWYDQHAFCIWDGGFLPSEAEWNYAAAGGSEQRMYPWSSPPTSATIDGTYAVYGGVPIANVGVKPAGNGKYGQADLAGNVWEWNLDEYLSTYVVPCNNCSYLPASSPPSSSFSRLVRGGAISTFAMPLLASYRDIYTPTVRLYYIGARCARTP